MKKSYLRPTINVVEVKTEKGFATSADTFGINQFQYDSYESDGFTPYENSAW